MAMWTCPLQVEQLGINTGPISELHSHDVFRNGLVVGKPDTAAELTVSALDQQNTEVSPTTDEEM